jgi:FSR family fosmidomycin resistance protein-like MFS transporter
VGGLSSDRIGRRPVLIAGLAVGVPVMLAGLLVPPGIVQAGLLALAGFCLLSATPVQLVAMQEMLPEHRSVAVGLTYFMTTSGAIVATLVVGALGEARGLSTALPIAVLTAALALPLLLVLRLPSPPNGVLVPSTVAPVGALPHTGAR